MTLLPRALLPWLLGHASVASVVGFAIASTSTTPTSLAVPTAGPSSPKAPCPKGMVLIEGERCPNAEQTCLRWLESGSYKNLRCAEFARPTTCKGPREARRYCIDREEYSERRRGQAKESALPRVNTTWPQAKALCEARGARLCTEPEWEFACEGPDMWPYPYGFERDATTCNIDLTDLKKSNGKLIDHRAPVSSFPECVSPFGVHNMTGNVDEWVARENAKAPNRSALRGGWWLPARNRCRAATLEHNERYYGVQVGFRCCKDAR